MTQTRDLEFSHMPEVGVSYGVKTEDGVAYLSVAFTNTEAGDVFNRRRANQIISGRIEAVSRGRETRAVSVPSLRTARQIVKDMRATFKPDGEVNEDEFLAEVPLGNTSLMVPIIRTPREGAPAGASIWEKLVEQFKNVSHG